MLSLLRREWPGAYFDGRSAARTEVAVRVTDEGIHVTGLPGGDAFWYHYEIRLAEAMAPGDPVRIERVSVGDEIVISDPALRDPLTFALGPHARTGAPARHGWGLGTQILALAAAAGVLVSALYLWVIPWAATRAATKVPIQWEERLGTTMVTALTREQRTCAGPARDAALEKMVATLTADGRGGPYTFKVTVLDDSMVNALAAPGGQIVFFRGLIDAAETPEELAGVMAHELQHIVLRHGTAGILRQIPIQLLVSAVTGSGNVGDQAFGVAATLGNLGYARRDESSADRQGMAMLQAARVGTSGMVTFMGRLSTLNKGEADPGMMVYLSTHPASADRANVLGELAATQQYTPLPLLTAVEWAAVRAPCER
jgi:beta-barrel assembly-enhancing protease